MAEVLGRQFDPTTGRPITVDPYHVELNSGDMYSVFQNNAALASNGIIYFELIVPATHEADLEGFEIFCTDLYTEVTVIEAPTLTTGVTALTPMNLKRKSANTAKVGYKSNPTSISGGTTLETFFTGGGTGTGQTKIGGTTHTQLGWLLKPSTTYLIRATNKSANAIIISIALLVSEHEI